MKSVQRQMVCLVAIGLTCVCCAQNGSGDGIGDSTFPSLGNNGYKASHYTLKLNFNPDTNLLQADVKMDGVTDAELGVLSLDFQGFTVSSVNLDGQPVKYERTYSKLRIEPEKPLASGAKFSTEIVYSGTPSLRPSAALPAGTMAGWISFQGGAVAVGEPDLAHTWFPCNDHPLNKASFDVEVTVPESYMAISNGLGSTADGHTYRYSEPKPTMTCMVTVAIGRYTWASQTGPNKLPITHYMTPDAVAGLGAAHGLVPQFIQYFTDHLGPYPFNSYGTITLPGAVSDACKFMEDTGLETTAIPVFGPASGGDEASGVHELAHQWMGDCVSVTNWGDDIWWVEGFAQYTEWLMLEVLHGKADYDKQVKAVATKFATKGKWLKPGHLNPEQMFTDRSYIGGALTFAALRAKLGDEKFFEVLKEFVAKNAYGNASEKDWLEVSNKVSGTDMKPFWDGWLRGDTEPTM